MTTETALRKALEACRPFVNYAATHDAPRMTAAELKQIRRAVRLTKAALART